VAPSGYYDWLGQPVSKRAQEEARPLHLISASFVSSQGINAAPRVFLDLLETAELYNCLLRGRGLFPALEPWQTDYLLVHAVWAAIVVTVFPPVFGFI
jgi:hypothetical protein